MANININYRSALILKHALERQLQEKELIINTNEVDDEFLNDYNIEKKTYEDFKSKIEAKFSNRITN